MRWGLWIGFCSVLACRGPEVLSLEATAGSSAQVMTGAPRTLEPDASPIVTEGGARSENSGLAPSLESPAAGGASDDGNCGAQAVTLTEVHSGRVRAGVRVSLEALVASSQKFLVSEAKSGSCLWGAYAAEPGRSGAGSGLFLVSFGARHDDGESCQPGADGLPDDLQPGDVLRVSGKVEQYVPAACDNVAPATQLVIDAVCPASRTARGEAPLAAEVDAAFASRLAAGDDAELARAWGGALVELAGVSAAQDSDDGDAVFPFGVVRLNETSLEVHSKLYYYDLRDGGPRAPGKAPRYAYPTKFEHVRGIVLLDYCSWALAPRDRCRDLDPPSLDCAGSPAR